MAKEPSKPGIGSGRVRRVGGRRPRPTLDVVAARMMRSPGLGWGVLIGLAFVIVIGMLAAWSRQQPLVAVGRIMDDTVLARIPLTLEDRETTTKQRETARQKTARVYRADTQALETIRSSLENLPKTFAGVEKPEDIAPEVRQEFGTLSPEAVAAIGAQVSDGEVSQDWTLKVRRLMELLRQRPMTDDKTWQRETQEGLNPRIELRGEDAAEMVLRDSIVNIKDREKLQEAATQMARAAGFTEPALSVVIGRLETSPEPTYQFDQAATVERQNQRVAEIATVDRAVPVGQVIFRRGEILDAAQLDLYRAELAKFRQAAEWWRVWAKWLSVVGAVGATTAAGAGYLALFCPPVRRSPARMAGIAALLAGALAVACWGTVAFPGLVMLTAIAPTVFVAYILTIAYDQRVALAISLLHGVLACIALDQPMGVFALIVTGVATAVWQLREIRDRRGLVRASLVTGLALAVGVVLVTLIDRPIVPGTAAQTARDAALAGFGGVLVGGVTLFILPSIERWFDITTGMTLIELRDPRQPLLRQLQQRAPGTYNHSLNVASIAEQAAEDIGADSLLAYVGSLYHDVGKMNKPDYFVENQSGGPNKHDKLSPAMSLLVIVGHVKDGLALAREHGLPQVLQHFIEAHHGTTLVEFFYNRARRQAEQAGAGREAVDPPAEIEYRYPGPRPRTREAAILMLSDAVESATRTMVEPTPSRIDALVRAIANKRLMDGQFDECDLTLRQLQTIVESISKSVASIYHGRIQYPSSAAETRAPDERRA